MRRRVLAAVIAAGCVAGLEAAASAASDRAPVGPQRVALVGCVAQTSDGAFQLRNAMRSSMAPRTGGSMSAKASTPVGNRDPTTDRRRTPGPGTAKGSTPVTVVPASLMRSAPTGANSPKASTPVAEKPVSYALDAADSDMASFAGSAVAVVGVLEQRVLKVETIRRTAGSCAR